MNLIDILGTTCFALGAITLVAGWIFIAVRRLVCGKQHKCRRDYCPLRLRGVCDWTAPSPTELDRLQKLIDEMNNEQAVR